MTFSKFTPLHPNLNYWEIRAIILGILSVAATAICKNSGSFVGWIAYAR
jgi:hypothetical protein